MKKKFAKYSAVNIFENKSYSLTEHFIAVILIPNLQFKKKTKTVLLIKKKKSAGCGLARNRSQ